MASSLSHYPPYPLLSSIKGSSSSANFLPNSSLQNMQDFYPFIIPHLAHLHHGLDKINQESIEEYSSLSSISPTSVLSQYRDGLPKLSPHYYNSLNFEVDQQQPSNSVDHHAVQAISKGSLAAEADQKSVYAGKKRRKALLGSKDTDSADNILKRTRSGESVLTSDGGNNAASCITAVDQKTQLCRSNALLNQKINSSRDISEDKNDLRNKEKCSNTVRRSMITESADNSPTTDQKPDFIHVRARRGQATDSHSLAERVRREKISERMKYLQDLVPGCVKVTGKAMMLDEIINYVQSLQRQVEFLSMKLAAVPPSQLEFKLENLLGKKVGQPILKEDSSVNHLSAVPTFSSFANDRSNEDSGYVSLSMNHCESMQEHELKYPSTTLPTVHHICSTADDYIASLPSDSGVDTALMERAALLSSLDAVLTSANQSCFLPHNTQTDLDWDDDVQNIAQQMGFLSQTPPLFPPH